MTPITLLALIWGCDTFEPASVTYTLDTEPGWVVLHAVDTATVPVTSHVRIQGDLNDMVLNGQVYQVESLDPSIAEVWDVRSNGRFVPLGEVSKPHRWDYEAPFEGEAGYTIAENYPRRTSLGMLQHTEELELTVVCHRFGTTTIDVEGWLYYRNTGQNNRSAATSFEVDCLPLAEDPTEGPTEGPIDDPTDGEEETAGGCALGGAPEMTDVIRVGDNVFGPGTPGADALCTLSDDQVSILPVLHSSVDIPPIPRALDHTSTFARGGIRIGLTQAELDNLAAEYPCGQHPTGETLCGSQAPLTPGDYILAYNVLHSDLVTDDGAYYTYGFPFDGDGDLANNYVSVAYPNDFYQNSDRWWEGRKYADSDFMLESIDARGGNFTWMQTDARMLMTGNLVMLVVPASEFQVDLPTYRLTSFEHLGDWGWYDPWSADVQPTVAEGLTPIQDATALQP